MNKENKGKSKIMANQQNESKIKQEPLPAIIEETSNENRSFTRASNTKEEGFYKFKNMMLRNVKSQEYTKERKIKKRPKKRVKSKSSQK